MIYNWHKKRWLSSSRVNRLHFSYIFFYFLLHFYNVFLRFCYIFHVAYFNHLDDNWQLVFFWMRSLSISGLKMPFFLKFEDIRKTLEKSDAFVPIA